MMRLSVLGLMVCGIFLAAGPHGRAQDEVVSQEMDVAADEKEAVEPGEVAKEQAQQVQETLSTEEKKEEKAEKVPPAKKPEAAPAKPARQPENWVECVAPLKDLVTFYQERAASVEEVMKDWNKRILASEKRNKELEEEMEQLGERIEDLQEAGGKRNRKEVSRLKKRLKRISKEQKIQAKESGEQRKDFVGALKPLAKEAQTALKMKYKEVQKEVQGTLE